MAVTSKIISITVAVVVTIMVGVVIAASLGTQDNVSEATDPQPTHTTSETLGTVNGTSGTLTEPQDSTSQTTEPPTQLEEFEVVDTAVDKDMTKSNLPKVVDVGMMGPTWSTQPYNEEYYMARLGMDDFNNYLEEIGAHWRMNLVRTENFRDPIVTLERIQRLDSEGVKFVLGPTSSAEIHHIKSYVDSNDMVIITSVSIAPSLAVVDNIFRFCSRLQPTGQRAVPAL